MVLLGKFGYGILIMSDSKDDKICINWVIICSGDDGCIGLVDGSCIVKDYLCIQVLGVLDEFNSGLGVLCVRVLDNDLDVLLEWIQQLLFDLGGELVVFGIVIFIDVDLVEVEFQVDIFNVELILFKEFVLLGGYFDVVWCYYCCIVVWCVEWDLIVVGDDDQVNLVSCVVFNCVGDLLFVMVCVINLCIGIDEL